ncbi:MAG: class I SAM-dependent methyltransferase [Candidatus Omnitrophota bacterium]
MLPRSISRFFKTIYSHPDEQEYCRSLIIELLDRFAVLHTPSPNLKILDLGCGQGKDLQNIRKHWPTEGISLYGVDSFAPHCQKISSEGITAYNINLEAAAIPSPDGYFDVVIANQIIEHTKEIFWVFSEVSRVLKKGGLLIVAVPNIASWHNRIRFLFGQPPGSLELLGPHVRGIMRPSFERFIQADGYFEVLTARGSGFYPFPLGLAKILCKVFPMCAVALCFAIRRTAKEGCFIEVLNSRFFETPYFRG